MKQSAIFTIHVALADVGVTEWRHLHNKIIATITQLHSLMLVLLNGGGKRWHHGGTVMGCTR